MTAEQLLSHLHVIGLDPSTDGATLDLTAPPPPELEAALDILAVPIVGLLTGRPVYAFDHTGRPVPGGGVIDPRRELPFDVRLVAVAGGEWDRISPAARDSFPHLFEPPPAEKAKRPSARKLERAK